MDEREALIKSAEEPAPAPAFGRSFRRALSPTTLRLLQGATLLLSNFCINGLLAGAPSLVGPLTKRGVYADKCTDANAAAGLPMDTVCSEQKHMLDFTITATVGILNVAGMFGGFITDALGSRRTAACAFALWAVATSIGGVAPSVGFVWSIGPMALANVAVAGSTLAAFTGMCAQVWPDAQSRLFGGAVTVATWDAGALFALILHFYFENVTALPLWALYLLYATVVGFGASAAVLLVYRPDHHGCEDELGATAPESSKDSLNETTPTSDDEREAASIQNADNDVSHLQENLEKGSSESDGGAEAQAEVVEDKLAVFKRHAIGIVTTAYFWGAVSVATSVVVAQSFYLGFVSEIALGAGAPKETADRLQDLISVAVACGAPFGFVMGQFLASRRLGPALAALVAAWIMAALAVIFAIIMVAAGHHSVGQYAALVVFGIWREWVFTFLLPVFVAAFASEFPAALGSMFGVVFGGAGVLAIGLGTGLGAYLTSTATREVLGVVAHHHAHLNHDHGAHMHVSESGLFDSSSSTGDEFGPLRPARSAMVICVVGLWGCAAVSLTVAGILAYRRLKAVTSAE